MQHALYYTFAGIDKKPHTHMALTRNLTLTCMCGFMIFHENEWLTLQWQVLQGYYNSTDPTLIYPSPYEGWKLYVWQTIVLTSSVRGSIHLLFFRNLEMVTRKNNTFESTKKRQKLHGDGRFPRFNEQKLTSVCSAIHNSQYSLIDFMWTGLTLMKPADLVYRIF